MVALPNGNRMFEKMKEVEQVLIGEDVEQAILMLGILMGTQLESLPKHTASGLFLFLTQTLSKAIMKYSTDEEDEDDE